MRLTAIRQIIGGPPGHITFPVRVRGSASVKLSCKKRFRAENDCCKTVDVEATVGPFNFDVTTSVAVGIWQLPNKTISRVRLLIRLARGVDSGAQLLPGVVSVLKPTSLASNGMKSGTTADRGIEQGVRCERLLLQREVGEILVR